MKAFFSTVALLLAPVAASYASTGSATGTPTTGPEPTPMAPSANVKPGESHDNGDTLVTNDEDSGANIRVTPKKGNADTATPVTFRNNSRGGVTGVDANDKVNVTSGATATISGSGGVVTLSGSNTTAHVTNYGSTGTMVVNSQGSTIYLSPGSSITVTL